MRKSRKEVLEEHKAKMKSKDAQIYFEELSDLVNKKEEEEKKKDD